MKEAAELNAQLRRSKQQKKKEELERDAEQMEAYKRQAEEEERRRQQQLDRHRHIAPVPRFASADRFDDDKYKRYFTSVDEAAARKAEEDARNESERRQRAKELADRCSNDIVAQMRARNDERRRRAAESARERVAAEADAERFNRSLSSQRERKRQEAERYRKDLEQQMLQAHERELKRIAAGDAPQTTRW